MAEFFLTDFRLGGGILKKVNIHLEFIRNILPVTCFQNVPPSSKCIFFENRLRKVPPWLNFEKFFIFIFLKSLRKGSVRPSGPK